MPPDPQLKPPWAHPGLQALLQGGIAKERGPAGVLTGLPWRPQADAASSCHGADAHVHKRRKTTPSRLHVCERRGRPPAGRLKARVPWILSL